MAGESIDVFNEGNHRRDFTYIDDVATGVIKTSELKPRKKEGQDYQSYGPGGSVAPYKLYNIGNSSPVALMDMIGMLEDELGIKAKKNFLPMQPGDVPETFADVNDLRVDTGYEPKTSLEAGIAKFVDWFKSYYKIS